MARDQEQSGLTLRKVVGEKLSSWLGGPARNAERRLITRWKRRRHGWRSHLHTYVAVISGLAFFNLLTGIVSGHLFPWFLYPAIGWGIGLAIHTLSYRAWVEENWEELEGAAESLGLRFEPGFERVLRTAAHRELPRARAPRWQALLTECQEAAERAEAVLPALPGDASELRDRLNEGLERVQKLAEGAERIQLALNQLDQKNPEADLADLDAEILATTDERLKEVHLANRTLLITRRAKIEALKADEKRMYANAKGFLLAVENLALDGARLGQNHSAEPLALSEPIERLTDEVRVLEQVEAELNKLP